MHWRGHTTIDPGVTVNKTVFYLYPCWFDPDRGTGVTTGKVFFTKDTFRDQLSEGIPIRLSANPDAIRSGLLSWNEIDCDWMHDRDSRGMTRIGPEFPGGKEVASLAVSEGLLARIPQDRRPPLPPQGFEIYEQTARLHEFMAIQTWDDATVVPNGRRYRGYHATRDDANLYIWPLGRSLDPAAIPVLEIAIKDFDWERTEPSSQVRREPNGPREGSLFIETNYAQGKLGLDEDPKLPISWETINARLQQPSIGGAFERALEASVPWDAPQFTFVDTQLTAMRRRRQYRARPERGRLSFDLVGHSTYPHHLLEVGGRYLGPAFAAELKTFFASEAFRSLGVERIRLLGCSTAVGRTAQRTMVALAKASGLEVYGTVTDIDNSHFNAHGFAERFTYLLVSHHDFVEDVTEQPGEIAFDESVSPVPRIVLRPLAGGSEPIEGCRPVAAVAEKGAGFLVLECLDEEWFGPYTHGLGEVIPVELIAPDAIVVRDDQTGPVHSEIYWSHDMIRYYPPGGHSCGVVHKILDEQRKTELRRLLSITD
jgi:hypothetical protein